MFPPERCDAAARASMKRLVERSKRHSGLQLPKAFLRGSAVEAAPLARMLSGGRGADIRIKLYLSTVLLAGSSHHHPVHGANVVDDVAGASWARALALPEPNGAGARQVAAAQAWLHDKKLLRVTRRPGREPLVRLRSADGKDRPWRRPTEPYLTVPIGLWSGHWLWFLSAKELAVLLALLDLQGGHGDVDTPEPQWMTEEDHERYGFSPETWRLGSKALKQKGLLETDFRYGLSRDFETPRRRKTFWVRLERLQTNALEGWAPDELSTMPSGSR